MNNTEERWQQRFIHFSKAWDQLKRFSEVESLNEMEQQGFIKAFEYTYELAWKTLKDYLNATGRKDIFGPRDTIMAAFHSELIGQGHEWMEMIQDRNLTVHTYDEEKAKAIIKNIRAKYLNAFSQLHDRLSALTSN